MRGIADKAWAAGFSVVRLNQRNCGGTEHLSRGLYHSGLTHDPLFLLRHLIDRERVPAVVVAGYSLGGNLTLKLAGDLGADAPPQLKAVCAVSPTIDLAVCVDALERRANLAYQWNFVRRLKARMRRKAAVYTSHVLSVPFLVMESDLLATLPYAVVTRFASLTSDVVAALPPFDISYDLKLVWHRRFDNEPRSRWLREQLAAVFRDHKWLQPPAGPAPFLHP